MTPNTSRTSRVAHPEIERLADLAFGVSRDRLNDRAAEKRRQALHQVRQTCNSGGYVPALVRCAEESIHEMILARADAYVEAFTVHGMACDALTESRFRTASQQIAAGANSALQGEFRLTSMRTRQPISGVAVGHANRQITAAMTSAIQEGLLRLKRQQAVAGAAVFLRSPANEPKETAEPRPLNDLEMMRRIDEWRKSAGPNGGKRTQKEVADMLGLDLRAYTAANNGKPRGQDHYPRIRKFATDKGII